MYGISSSNLLTLQIVESLSYGNKDSQSQNNLTNTDILMDMREKQNLIGLSSKQIDTYNSPSSNNQIQLVDGKIYNREPKLYNKVSLKRIF